MHRDVTHRRECHPADGHQHSRRTHRARRSRPRRNRMPIPVREIFFSIRQYKSHPLAARARRISQHQFAACASNLGIREISTSRLATLPGSIIWRASVNTTIFALRHFDASFNPDAFPARLTGSARRAPADHVRYHAEDRVVPSVDPSETTTISVGSVRIIRASTDFRILRSNTALLVPHHHHDRRQMADNAPRRTGRGRQRLRSHSQTGYPT